MEIVILRLGDLSFRLRSGTDPATLERRLVAAVKRGADIVRLPLSGEGELDAVVSSGVPVAVERHETSETVDDGGFDDAVPNENREPAIDWLDVELVC